MAKSRLVVKVGTSTLLEAHEQPTSVFATIAASIKDALLEFDIILVTSGATGFGVRRLGLPERPDDLSELQALASIGQTDLMGQWRNAMGEQPVGQVLVTARELTDQEDSQRLTATFEAMWNMGVVPIVNENDAITGEEFTFGDNDKLSALVASAISAQYLLLLTDQDGIYADFGKDTQVLLAQVSVDDARMHLVLTKSVFGTGGMASKLVASEIAIRNGTQPFVAHAQTDNVIQSVLSGESGTKLV